jgi:hypothetical protein
MMCSATHENMPSTSPAPQEVSWAYSRLEVRRPVLLPRIQAVTCAEAQTGKRVEQIEEK